MTNEEKEMLKKMSRAVRIGYMIGVGMVWLLAGVSVLGLGLMFTHPWAGLGIFLGGMSLIMWSYFRAGGTWSGFCRRVRK